jgi:hypothetical protein
MVASGLVDSVFGEFTGDRSSAEARVLRTP